MNQAKGFLQGSAIPKRACACFPATARFLATSFPGKMALPVYTVNNTVLTHLHTQGQKTLKSLNITSDWEELIEFYLTFRNEHCVVSFEERVSELGVIDDD